MFGENSMYGTSDAKVDVKHRIMLPDFTGVEVGDVLIMLAVEDEMINIIAEQKMDEFVKALEKRIAASNDEDEKKILQGELTKLLEAVLKKVTVKSNKRITLTGSLASADYIKVVGAREYVYLKRAENILMR